ncbi:MAG: hypothetical protein AAB336_12400 [Acidobacteriota bacterium]
MSLFSIASTVLIDVFPQLALWATNILQSSIAEIIFNAETYTK